jgi:hypothetical protein
MTAPAHAQLDKPFWYAGVHGGAYYVTETQYGVTGPYVDPLFGFEFDGLHQRLSVEETYDIGYAIGGVVGRQFTPWIGLEGEYTLRKADYDENRLLTDGTETHAFFGNLILRWPTTKPIEFYAGFGGGFVANNYRLVSASSTDGDAVIEEEGASFDNSWALQVKGGLDWFVTDRQSFGLEAGYHRGQDAKAEDIDDARFDSFFEIGGATILFTAKSRF